MASEKALSSDKSVEYSEAVLELKMQHQILMDQIESRLSEFRRIWQEGSDEDVFAELAFCILTPQSRAKACWASIEGLLEKKLLLSGDSEQINRELYCVRFKYRKAEYLVEARRLFSADGKIAIKSRIAALGDAYSAREWLVQNVLGIGYKEASHFLRNIGLGEDIAILDRHILKNLRLLGVIEEVPASLTKRRYLEIEKKMGEFAEMVGIPMSHLDLLLWYRETGEIFK